ncbi:reverse transcriptase family protein [Pseudooceanicola onchidii]|uniref:reverse transcriptase family protein n=1 Tax=Pseudooceanicola onchidii TaxID=2562279 RepID=UPI0010A9AB94|nr:reverse transcriptase family protein [Pseudooceanicola onchidii]
MRRNKKPAYERYDLDRSPFAQRPTQRDVADLLGETKADLERLINYKDQFVVRRQERIAGKDRDLAYPTARLRGIHERLKFHLNKVRQPSYLFSPRKKRSQRDNAELHLDQDQYLTLDIKQFYPSTTDAMVFRWFKDELGMYDDVAGMLTHLCTIDGKASFGSPLTPVLCTLVHRPMFDSISDICSARGLRHSLWVDDLTISGRFVPGKVVTSIRTVIQDCGLRSHKIRYRSGNRPVVITGIGVVGRDLVAPNSLNLRIRRYWDDLHEAVTADEKAACAQLLMSQLGTVRHIVGAKSDVGQRAADQMNMLKQKRAKWLREANAVTPARQHDASVDAEDMPF